jgi:hypothetical protein
MTDVSAVLDDVGSFRDKFGKLIEREGNAWLVHTMKTASPYRLDFTYLTDLDYDDALGTALYLKHQLQINGSEHARNTFSNLTQFLESAPYRLGGDFLTAFRNHKRSLRTRFLEYTLHFARDWYLWCSDQSLPGFDDAETYWALRNTVIPGNPKGVAVTTADPNEGPLREVEENALRAALQQSTIDLPSLVLVWLFLTLGPNPLNVALLRESDLIHYTLAGQNFYELKVPRIKKRVRYRAEFRTRKIEGFLGALLVQLREDNLKKYPQNTPNRPLFWSSKPRAVSPEWREFEYHLSAVEIALHLQTAVEGLNVISPITGQPLRIYARRLRYTFATRLVRQGCDSAVLADLLDHSDEQYVLVYFANRDAQKKIDEATNERFGPRAARFLGRIVEDESEAGGTAATRIKEPINLMDLGTCGNEGLCDKALPHGCYQCPKFIAWKHAPHERFLRDVKRIAASPRDAVQMSDIISAISQVVEKCKTE